MKKFTSLFLFAVLSLFSLNLFAASSQAGQANPGHSEAQKNTTTLYFFWSKDCPHCVAAHPYIEKLKAEYSWLRVKSFEISGNPRNSRLFEKMSREHGRETSFVPAFFVCDKMIVGYTSAATTGAEIRNAVRECHNRK